ncbi:hypothetical protein GLW05_20820 [Pontibacillus yanchengensis]|uniref:Uncharacterized protein n=1 Tax=Pontibacillus yanchengensis TaxID=462910 RepID=A0A6I5A6S7_9BACI|nr:hypothetical protein [Pontibacillus yanchengensis]MYL36017.1 hypothetical protein [Pontibacillus yanchengensis]
MKIYLAGKEVNVRYGTFSFSKEAGSDDSCSFDVDVYEGDTYEFAKGTRVEVEDFEGITIFKGFIWESDEGEFSEFGEELVSVDCVSEKWILQKTYVTGEVEDEEVGTFLQRIVDDIGLGFSLGKVHSSSELIPYKKYEYMKVSDLFDKVTDIIDGYWNIDTDLNINFLKVGTENGGDFNESEVAGEVKRKNTNDGYANKIILSNYRERRQKTEYKVGDGENKVFTLSHPIDYIVEIFYVYLDETTGEQVKVTISEDEIKERGEEGSGESGVKINYSRGADTIEWVDDNYTLKEKDVLSITYTGLVKLENFKNDVEEQQRFSNINKRFSVVPYVVTDLVIGKDNADRLMSMMLKKKKEDAIVLNFATYTRLEVGKTYNCMFPTLNLNDQFIVNKVDYVEEPTGFKYAVEISRGNYSTDWNRFYSDLEIELSKEETLGSASGNGYKEVDVNLSEIEDRTNRPVDVQIGRIWLLRNGGL